MPDLVDVIPVGVAEAADGMFGKQLVEAFTVQNVEHGPGAPSAAHLFHGRLVETPPVVGEGGPIHLEAPFGAELGQIVDDTGPPIDHSAENVEQ